MQGEWMRRRSASTLRDVCMRLVEEMQRVRSLRLRWRRLVNSANSVNTVTDITYQNDGNSC